MSPMITALLVLCLGAFAVLSWLQLSVVMPRVDELASRRQGPSSEEEQAWETRARLHELQSQEAEIRDKLARMEAARAAQAA